MGFEYGEAAAAVLAGPVAFGAGPVLKTFQELVTMAQHFFAVGQREHCMHALYFLHVFLPACASAPDFLICLQVRRMSREHGYGCILGACIGDAAGAPLEFTGQAVDRGAIVSAMCLEGGGPLGTAPGQFTDDSEMALALVRGIGDTPPEDPFPADAVASAYQDWYKSHPIDAGFTCKTACVLSLLEETDPLVPVRPGAGGAMTDIAAKYSMRSKANGGVMRCMPIAVWCHRLADEDIAEKAIADCALTHPNDTCKYANAAYCIAGAHLIRRPGDAKGAVRRVAAYCESSANAEVRGWLHEALSATTLPPCDDQIGFVRWAFTYALICLNLEWSFERSLASVLVQKGDSDTNAAIVMGLMGALHGADGIPLHMREKLLAAVPRNQRPDWLCNAHIPKAFDRLWTAAAGASRE